MTDIRSFDLNLLRVLDVLLAEKSVSKAASRLHVTQPSVSASLKKLRDLFEDELFVRTPNGLTATPRANEIQGEIKALLQAANRLIVPPVFAPGEADFTVNIAANAYHQSVLLVPFIKTVRARAQGIKFSIFDSSHSDTEKRLMAGDMDLLITYPKTVPNGFESCHLYTDESTCLVRHGHPLQGEKMSEADFSRYPKLLVAPAGLSLDGPLYKPLRDSDVSKDIAVTVPSYAMLIELLQTDNYIAMLHKRLLQGVSQAIRQVAPPFTMPKQQVLMAWHPRFENDASHRWLRQNLIAIAQAD